MERHKKTLERVIWMRRAVGRETKSHERLESPQQKYNNEEANKECVCASLGACVCLRACWKCILCVPERVLNKLKGIEKNIV